jgi:hypothetical protein
LAWQFEGSCIRCTSHASQKGYPCRAVNGKLQRIARVLMIRRHGEYPSTRHTCDNHWCINPDHILGGTQKDNIQDMWERGREFSLSKMDASRRREIARMGGIAVHKIEAEKKWKEKHDNTATGKTT